MADIIFTIYLLLLGGYTYVTYSKRFADMRFKMWMRGMWLG